MRKAKVTYVARICGLLMYLSGTEDLGFPFKDCDENMHLAITAPWCYYEQGKHKMKQKLYMSPCHHV